MTHKGHPLQILLVVMLWAPTWTHAAGEPESAGILQCRKILDDSARLACFDREGAKLAATVGTPEQRFGFGSVVATKELTADPELSELKSTITDLKRSGDGRLVVYLENGQVWRQLTAEGDLLAKVGDAAVLTPGALGSVWLAVPSGRRCKVTRLK